VDENDIAAAVSYVLAPRAIRIPAGAEAQEEFEEEQPQTQVPPPPDQRETLPWTKTGMMYLR